MTTGYSGTPLAKKLGLERGMRVWFHHMPDSVRAEIDPEGLNVDEQGSASAGLQGAHIFVTERVCLERELGALRALLAPNGFVWVSWPKQAAKVATDITENVIREVALPTGLVDVKVLRDRRGLVGPQAGNPQGTPLTRAADPGRGERDAPPPVARYRARSRGAGHPAAQHRCVRLPEAAYFNPRAYGGWHGPDLAVYLFNFILFDGKMRGLFSLLFGASMLLVIERAEAGGRSAARVHYSRMLWLLAFGLAHLWLVWDGDILCLYALVGMVAFLFRRMPGHKLMALGVVLVLVACVMLGSLPAMILAAQATPPGTPHAANAARLLASFQNGLGVPAPAEIARELALYRGGYADLVASRLRQHPLGPAETLVYFGAETLGYMLFGMAALRSGLLRGEWARRDYARWAAIGFGIGIPAYAAMAAYMLGSGFALFRWRCR
ncbi:MAG: hypothetical protein WDN44_11640 [Sphingomonas sp.]